MSSLTPQALRRLFPALREYVWLNAAASSPLPQPVADAVAAHLAETVQKGDVALPAWVAHHEATRARLARFVGAEPHQVAFTPSTSFGFHVVAELLRARGVTEVLTLEGEFPSTTVPFLHRGLALRAVRRRPDGRFPLEDIEAALTPRTGAVAVSVVQFASGYRVDVAGLARLCRDKRLPLALNAAQALGQVPVDVAALGADFLAATSHKWLWAGLGAGVLVVRGDWLEALPLPLAGWRSVPPEKLWEAFPGAVRAEDAAGFTVQGAPVRRDATALELGATTLLPSYALDAALALHEALGPGTALAHNQALQRRLRAGLRARGFVPTAPDDEACLSGICVVKVQGRPEDAVRALLREAKVMTTPRGGGVRLSTHAYNDEGDVDAALAAFDRLGLRPG